LVPGRNPNLHQRGRNLVVHSRSGRMFREGLWCNEPAKTPTLKTPWGRVGREGEGCQTGPENKIFAGKEWGLVDETAVGSQLTRGENRVGRWNFKMGASSLGEWFPVFLNMLDTVLRGFLETGVTLSKPVKTLRFSRRGGPSKKGKTAKWLVAEATFAQRKGCGLGYRPPVSWSIGGWFTKISRERLGPGWTGTAGPQGACGAVNRILGFPLEFRSPGLWEAQKMRVTNVG